MFWTIHSKRSQAAHRHQLLLCRLLHRLEAALLRRTLQALEVVKAATASERGRQGRRQQQQQQQRRPHLSRSAMKRSSQSRTKSGSRRQQRPAATWICLVFFRRVWELSSCIPTMLRRQRQSRRCRRQRRRQREPPSDARERRTELLWVYKSRLSQPLSPSPPPFSSRRRRRRDGSL